MSDGFRFTRNCVGDCSPHAGRLSEEELGTEEEEQGTWEGKATTLRVVDDWVCP